VIANTLHDICRNLMIERGLLNPTTTTTTTTTTTENSNESLVAQKR